MTDTSIIDLKTSPGAILKRAKELYYTGKEEPVFWGDLTPEEQDPFINLAKEEAGV